MNDSTPPDETSSAAATSRRVFLTRLAAFGIVPTSIGWMLKHQRNTTAASSKATTASVSPSYGLADFLPLIGNEFIQTDIGAPALTLSKADAGKHHQPEIAEQFSLRFSVPDGHPFESRIYQLRHPVLGNLEIFISPVGSAAIHGGQQKGEAVFNHARRIV